MTMSTPAIIAIISALITGIFGPILVRYVQHKFTKVEEKPDMVKDALAVSKIVHLKIDELKEEIKADRVWITQFHNGGHFYPTGKSIAKFSMIYEVVEAGINSIQNSFQNIPVSLFSKSTNHLLENDIIEIPNYKDSEAATFGLKYVAEESGCKSGYLFAIKSIDHKFIGILGIDFVKTKTKLEEEQIQYLTLQATAIGGVLYGHLYN
jgi:hypothetical protein